MSNRPPVEKEDLNLDPSKGYTQTQIRALYARYSLKEWALDSDRDMSRFVYLNLPRFFPHAVIQRAGPISPLQSAPDPDIGKTSAKTYAGEMTLDAWAAGHLDGCIVVRDGKIIYETYPRMRPNDKHIWWSVSKTFTGTAVGLLEEQGLVDVEQPIETYIAALSESAWSGTPVIDILDMASGMTGLESDDPEAYTNPDSPYALYESSLGYQVPTEKTMKSTYEYMTTMERQKPSGQVDEYTSVNTFVLAWLLEDLLDKPFAEIVSELFWSKIGAQADALLGVSAIGAPGASGLISSTLRDLARYGLLYTPSWRVVAREQVIPDALIKRIQTEGRPALYQAGSSKAVWDDYMGEACLWGTRQFDFVTQDGDFAKTGYHGQTFYISPGKNLVVASFGTGEEYDTYRYARAIAKAL